jgi:hypothetical protein
MKCDVMLLLRLGSGLARGAIFTYECICPTSFSAGSPGIGKSFMLFYLLYRLATRPASTAPPAIVLQIHNAPRVYCFQGSSVTEADTLVTFKKELDDSATWCAFLCICFVSVSPCVSCLPCAWGILNLLRRACCSLLVHANIHSPFRYLVDGMEPKDYAANTVLVTSPNTRMVK